MERLFMENAKVMAKGQVTIPKEVREVLRLKNGDKVTFIVEGNNVRVVNAAVYAMEMFAREMKGEAEKAGVSSDEDVIDLIKELRSEDETE